MREYKFRGLAKTGWVYGLPFYSYGTGQFKITHSNGWVPTYQNPDEGETTEHTNIKAKTLTQYTGLKDKNGVEIYEGDILQIYLKPKEKDGKPGKVVFLDGGFYVVWGGDCGYQVPLFFYMDKLYRKINFNATEVVGNIYENPELIK